MTTLLELLGIALLMGLLFGILIVIIDWLLDFFE
jgi:hypothetical protein